MGNNFPQEDTKSISCKEGDLPALNIISTEEIKLDRNRKYRQFVFFKPFGLWVGICNSWYDFWYGEKMGKIKGKFIYEVSLFPDSYTRQKRYRKGKYPKKILIIETLDDIEYINREYGRHEEDTDPAIKNHLVDWQKFSERYGGIEIRNYINDIEVKMNNAWYSTVDVDSLCIWDLSIVKEIKLHDSM